MQPQRRQHPDHNRCSLNPRVDVKVDISTFVNNVRIHRFGVDISTVARAVHEAAAISGRHGTATNLGCSYPNHQNTVNPDKLLP